MSPGAARAVMVQLSLAVTVNPRVAFSLAGHQQAQQRELQLGKLSA
jgi:hypothetical protein